MAQFTAIGQQTKTIFLNEAESHKLHLAFTVAAGQTVKKGQPVKLNNAGEILTPALDGSENHLIIGYSIMNTAAGEECTIAMRAYAVVFAVSAASQNAGPVSFNGFGTDTDYTKYGAESTPAEVGGWALDSATAAQQLIRVALR